VKFSLGTLLFTNPVHCCFFSLIDPKERAPCTVIFGKATLLRKNMQVIHTIKTKSKILINKRELSLLSLTACTNNLEANQELYLLEARKLIQQ